MDESKALQQASDIAQHARNQARQIEVEAMIQSLEKSPDKGLQSIARAFRMLQNPFG